MDFLLAVPLYIILLLINLTESVVLGQNRYTKHLLRKDCKSHIISDGGVIMSLSHLRFLHFPFFVVRADDKQTGRHTIIWAIHSRC